MARAGDWLVFLGRIRARRQRAEAYLGGPFQPLVSAYLDVLLVAEEEAWEALETVVRWRAEEAA